MVLALFLGIILGTGLTIFTIENATMVTVSLLTWQLTAPLAFVLVGVIGTAVLATLLGTLPTLLRSEKHAKKLQKENGRLVNELAKYQITIPIAPPAPGSRTLVFEQEAQKSYAA